MARYVFRTLNSKACDADDCVVNALCLTAGGSWLKNFRDLCKVSEILYLMPNDVKTVERYMRMHKFQKLPEYDGTTAVTVNGFADSHPKGKYCVMTNGHLSAVIDGVIYDQINSSRMRVKAVYLIAR